MCACALLIATNYSKSYRPVLYTPYKEMEDYRLDMAIRMGPFSCYIGCIPTISTLKCDGGAFVGDLT